MPPRKRLGQVLLELGVIDEHQLQSALGHQKQWGGKLGGILVQKGFCAEEDVVAALAKHLGTPRTRLAEVKIDPRALKYVSKAIAERLHVLPYEISGSGRSEVVTVAMSDPLDLSAVDQLAFHTGKRIKPMLAGDGEIIAAIHANYGGSEEKKESTDKVARPAAPQPPPAPAAPAGAVAPFPKRIEPPVPGAPARSAPYIPPPIPAAKPAAPVQKMDEIEPEEAVARAKPPPPPPPPPARPIVPPPVDLPEDDGQDFGLEPIAAHSQFGDEVSGQEDVAGEGAAGDAVEGLVSASVAHAGAAEARLMDGLDAIPRERSSAAASGWTAPIESMKASGNGSEGQTGWDVSAPATGAGWGAEPAAAPGGWTGPVAADGWASNSPASEGEGWSLPAPDGEAEAPSEALPPDAILGTAPILVPPSEEPAPEPAPAEPDSGLSPPSSGPPVEVQDATSEADAPDAWASSEDPLAAEASVEDPLAAHGSVPDPLAAPEGVDDPLAAAAEARDGSAGGGLPASKQELSQEELSQEELSQEELSQEELSQEELSQEELSQEELPQEELPQEKRPQEELPPPTRDDIGELAGSYGLDMPASEEPEAAPRWHGIGDRTDRIGMPPVREAAPEPRPALSSRETGWIGEAPEGGTPLSPADLVTLESIGVDPGDGVGALRLLAVLIRILNRNQLIEPGDLREEIRESQEQGAAAAAEHAAYGMESPGASPAGPSETADT